MRRVSAHIRVYGRVQGVFFRVNMKDVADGLGVSGWVRNLPDGSVEAYAEGSEDSVRRLVEWCHRGPPSARVDKVEVSWSGPAQGHIGFRIRQS
ncbi:MAG: acylphosphatase [Nitrososphaerota archaeon]